MIPRVLRNFNAFVNGVGYAGRISEAELPELSVKTDEYRGGGQDIGAEIDLGMEPMSATLKFGEYIADVLKTFGKMDGLATRITLKGAIQRDGETAVPVVAELHGGVKKSSLGSWKPGEGAEHEMEMSVRYYKLTIANDLIYEIDVDNMVRNIGGTDELASIRAAIGL